MSELATNQPEREWTDRLPASVGNSPACGNLRPTSEQIRGTEHARCDLKREIPLTDGASVHCDDGLLPAGGQFNGRGVFLLSEPGKSLLDALPKKLERRVLAINRSAFPVFTGNEEQVVVVLKFEPSDIIDAAPVWFV